jgi:hypothetical protein
MVLTRTISHVPDQPSCLHGSHKNHLTCPGSAQLSAWPSQEPSHISRTSSAVCMALRRTISHIPDQLSCLHGSHKNHLTCPGPAQLSAWLSQEPSHMSRPSSAICIVLTGTISHVPDQLICLHGSHENHLTCPGPAQLSAWLLLEPSRMSRTISAVCMTLTRTISHVPDQLNCLNGPHKNHLPVSSVSKRSQLGCPCCHKPLGIIALIVCPVSEQGPVVGRFDTAVDLRVPCPYSSAVSNPNQRLGDAP